MPRILLLLPTQTYRARDYLAAAQRLGLQVTVAKEEPSAVEALQPDALLTLDLGVLADAAAEARAFAARHRIDGVLGVDERSVRVTARIAAELGLRHHGVTAAETAADKRLMREALAAARVPQPAFQVHRLDGDAGFVDGLRFPCVLKPLHLSGSRGVMRVDDPRGARRGLERLRRLLATDELQKLRDPAAEHVLVEEFVPGFEVALEGLLVDGELRVLALFDKPDPLDGPFFAETLYVTPSRLPVDLQRRIAAATRAAASAMGLANGPCHAELRIDGERIVVLEVAARTIGGLCSRSLRFGLGTTLEEIVLRQALGMPLPELERERAAAGVLMLPVLQAGRLLEVRGQAAARAVDPRIELEITAHQGDELVPLPEGRSYLGFLFARAETPAEVEALLRDAAACLQVVALPP